MCGLPETKREKKKENYFTFAGILYGYQLFVSELVLSTVFE